MRTDDVSYPRRYNSLRLLGFDYSSTSLYFITMNTHLNRPVFGDLNLAKTVLGDLLGPQVTNHLRVQAFTLLPDHLHVIASVRNAGTSISGSLGAFKSFTTQQYWKRAREVVEQRSLSLPPSSIKRAEPDEARNLLRPLMEWRASLRPEALKLNSWPNVRAEHFLSKQLWQRSFHDHIIRNDDDLRETVKYIAMNPVRRGCVTKPQYYPFTGFCFAEDEADGFAIAREAGCDTVFEGGPAMESPTGSSRLVRRVAIQS
jgi:REP element-mobilizing transposase RayT